VLEWTWRDAPRIHQTDNQQEAIMESHRLAILSCMFDDVTRLKALLWGCCPTLARFLDKKTRRGKKRIKWQFCDKCGLMLPD
jgi:hypothetical protein